MTDDEIDAFAEALIDARRTGRLFAAAASLPRSRSEAYAVQARVARALGPVGGFKTARKPDEDPIMAPILQRDMVSSGASVPVAGEMGVELEVGMRVRAPIPARPSDDDLRRCLEPVAVIELVATRIAGAAADDPIVKLADNQINFGLVVGDAAPDRDGADFREVRASLRAGDDELIAGSATVPGGSAYRAVRGLLDVLGDHCGGLSPGLIVITGALHPLTYLPAGTRIQGRIEGIGSVGVDFQLAPAAS